jgi:murein DD-endopeptidase MepM/ murein hydrolase activator NlpD
MRALLITILLVFCEYTCAVDLQGQAIQGGLIFGQAEPGSTVTLDGNPVVISAEGRFVFGFGRDESGIRHLRVISPQGAEESRDFKVETREYRIERVDGLPPKTVTPSAEALARIREESRMVASARRHRDDAAYYATSGFDWPATGRISGVYGSQRVLNGEPRRPHFGLDIAAPEGSEVYAPADGLVTMTHPDMYFSGGTLILDHGQGLSSSFLHLSQILVEAGSFVRQGDLIGRVGQTGRASGPHLDWRMNWLDRRVDPQYLLPSRENR